MTIFGPEDRLFNMLMEFLISGRIPRFRTAVSPFGRSRAQRSDLTSTSMTESSCPFLDFPVDIIHNIADHLSPHGRLVLSQTCRAMNNALWTRSHGADGKLLLDRGEKYQYLSCVARERLDQWLCGRCHKLHPVDLEDIPHVSDESSARLQCQRRRRPVNALNDQQVTVQPRNIALRAEGEEASLWEVERHGEGVRVRIGTGYSLHQNHIQFALRTVRLKDSGMATEAHVDYLERLMTPYQGVVRGMLKGKPATLATHYVAPKVCQGRFLVLNEWRLTDDILRPEGSNGELIAGFHVSPAESAYMFSRKRGDGWYSLPRSRKYTLLKWCIATTKVKDSCQIHWTDYEVKGTKEHVIVRMWQDLGPEIPVTCSRAPQTLTRYGIIDSQARAKWQPDNSVRGPRGVYRVLGNEIRDLYESTMK
ncbi:hypothetical protein HIM_03861 [Hirsutella minnesotensis 3608]|uniref:F-box domain-containing protein n=1 Tax=Hirsutella minnesotensis 3608 TaxID=1043627 RepID=A0A0F8A6F4_9HYPO|nr:hypothetical protein HIM_03861 [Hirsutella minnesotensis 3608]